VSPDALLPHFSLQYTQDLAAHDDLVSGPCEEVLGFWNDLLLGTGQCSEQVLGE
jgi:hypothetical protein